MKKYRIAIEETLRKVVEIEAETARSGRLQGGRRIQ